MAHTLTEYRRAAAAQIAPFYLGTATSGSTTAQLEMTGWPFTSSKSQDDLFSEYLIFRPNATTASDKTRTVDDSGYTPSGGIFLPDQNWSVSPYANSTGETIELHGLLPPISDGVNDLHTLINEALKRCRVRVEFTFSVASTTARQHSLASAAAWLAQEWQVRSVGYLQSSESRTDYDPFAPGRLKRGTVLRNGNTLYLEGWSHGNTADTIYVEAVATGYDWCATSNGSFGGQSGLSLESDRAIPDPQLVAMGVLVEAWNRFPYLLDATAGQRPIRSKQEAAQRLSLLAGRVPMPQDRYTTTGNTGRLLAWGGGQG